MRRQDAATNQNRMLFLTAVLMSFVLQSVTACDTFEVGIEDAGPTTQLAVQSTPTATLEADWTTPSAIPGGTPEPTVAPKDTRQPTPDPTSTPQSVLTSSGPPRIISFVASPSPADPTGAITLSWEARGASSVTVQWADKDTHTVARSHLPLSGSLSVTLAEVKFSEGDQVRFILLAYDANDQLMVDENERPIEKRLSIPLKTDMTITSFTASPDPVERGGTVTLNWNAPGAASIGITRLSPEGDIFLETEAFDLPASGSIALQVPEQYTELVKYYLGARDANGVLHKAYVTVGVICRYDKYIAPQCPLTQDYIWAAYEPFERGHMVWRSDTREIHVLYADGSYETYEDTWREGDPFDIPGTPSSGLRAPVRSFGNLYAHQSRVREGLGWATAPEASYTMGVETIRGGSGRYPGTSVYFTLPDNHVVNLYPFTSTWEIID